MNSDSSLPAIAAWQQERRRIQEERRQKLAGLPCVIPPDLLDPEDRLPRFPWAWYRDQLVVLRPAGTASHPHRFGGATPGEWAGLNPGCEPHLLLTLQSTFLPLGLPASGPVADGLRLFFPFRNSREPELVYRQEPSGRCVAVKSPKRHSGDRKWPYPNYPAELPHQSLAVDGPYPTPFLALFPGGERGTLSVQDLPEDAAQFLIVVVTAREATLGVSLLGPEAEDSAAQIVFIVDPVAGSVWTYSQCT